MFIRYLVVIKNVCLGVHGRGENNVERQERLFKYYYYAFFLLFFEKIIADLEEKS